LKKKLITLFFEKNANFFAENWQKSQKIVIITSIPGWPDWAHFACWVIHCSLWVVFNERSGESWATFFHIKNDVLI
jgi:hypothetical protein